MRNGRPGLHTVIPPKPNFFGENGVVDTPGIHHGEVISRISRSRPYSTNQPLPSKAHHAADACSRTLSAGFGASPTAIPANDPRPAEA